MRLISDGKPLYLGDKKEFQLTANYYIDWASISPITNELVETTYFVPLGFISDLASVPSLFFWLQWGVWNIAAIHHDFCYANGFVYQLTDGFYFIAHEITRKESDRLFLKICLSLGVNPLLAHGMYLAVRIFGGSKWQGSK